MNQKKHQKHAKLIRPDGGNFHRLEFGFLGAPCGTIQKLTAAVAEKLNHLNLTYVDADHGEGENFDAPFKSIFTDKISFHRFDTKSSILENSRFLFNNQDAVLVNGNHFKTDRQILILNEKKRESLKRKMDRVNKVEMIILDTPLNDLSAFEEPDSVSDLTVKTLSGSSNTDRFMKNVENFDFVENHVGNLENVGVFHISQVNEIANHLSEVIKNDIPKVKGVLFAGGKSTRMGTDKGEVKYHNLPQRDYLANLMKPFCESIYLSGREGQNFDSDYETIQDKFVGLGPYGGLLSAFQKFPNNAIFTLPIDVPFVDEALLQQLFENRNPSRFATCFHNPETNFPEPLITIWEPRAYPILLNFLSKGYSCPRKVLINSEVEELILEQPEKLFNANTPEQRDFAKSKL